MRPAVQEKNSLCEKGNRLQLRAAGAPIIRSAAESRPHCEEVQGEKMAHARALFESHWQHVQLPMACHAVGLGKAWTSDGGERN